MFASKETPRSLGVEEEAREEKRVEGRAGRKDGALLDLEDEN